MSFILNKNPNLPTRIPGLEKRSRQRFADRNGKRDVDEKSGSFLLFELLNSGFLLIGLAGIVSPNTCDSS